MANPAPTPYEDRILRPNREQWSRLRNPPAWAQYRQDMMKAVAWCTSIQSGVWLTTKGSFDRDYVDGMLIGKFTGARSYMDAEIVITSLNGDDTATLTSNPTKQRQAAMANTINARRPVGLVIEKGSTIPQTQKRGKRQASGTTPPDLPPLFPCNNMPTQGDGAQNCWLADFFLAVAMWPTKVPGSDKGRVWMVKLEKCNLEEQSWWANSQHGPPPRAHERNTTIRTRQEQCSACGASSPRIYQELFICLNDSCSQCWCKAGQVISKDEVLTYTTEFLQERQVRPSSPVALPPLVEDFQTWWQIAWYGPMSRNEQVTRENLETWKDTLLRGFCCPYCAMLNCRVQWHQWRCRNSACNDGSGSAFHANGYPPVLTLQQATALASKSLQLPDFSSLRGFESTRDLPLFNAHEFKLGPGCYVAYLQPKEKTNSLPGGSDYLYTRMQQLANDGSIPLERRGQHTMAGTVFTGHFAVNYGELYHISSRVGTIDWDDSQTPPEIRQARDMVNDWCSPYRTPTETPANELYIAGYWYGQRMSWHDDGETGLEDLITTYTLGGTGQFKLRVKPKYDYGRGTDSSGSKTSFIHDDPVIPGCEKEQERRALRDRLDQGQITQDQWQEEFEKLMKDVTTGSSRGSGTSGKVILEFPVYHGHLVLMYGPNTQKYFHHCVSVDSPMRFALTFRHITSTHYDNFNRVEHGRRLLSDGAYDPDKDWVQARQPSPVDEREPSPVPAVMEEDGEPLRKRQREEDDDDDKNSH